MGRQHAGLDVLLGEFCFEERELPRLSHMSRLGSDLGFSACYLSFEIFLYLELHLVENCYVVGFIYVEDMALMLRRFDSAVTLCWKLFLCMIMLMINCRSDNYF